MGGGGNNLVRERGAGRGPRTGCAERVYLRLRVQGGHVCLSLCVCTWVMCACVCVCARGSRVPVSTCACVMCMCVRHGQDYTVRSSSNSVRGVDKKASLVTGHLGPETSGEGTLASPRGDKSQVCLGGSFHSRRQDNSCFRGRRPDLGSRKTGAQPSAQVWGSRRPQSRGEVPRRVPAGETTADPVRMGKGGPRDRRG